MCILVLVVAKFGVFEFEDSVDIGGQMSNTLTYTD